MLPPVCAVTNLVAGQRNWSDVEGIQNFYFVNVQLWQIAAGHESPLKSHIDGHDLIQYKGDVTRQFKRNSEAEPL